jgi:pimeloyl-ACP methyl ester carboxylesterase
VWSIGYRRADQSGGGYPGTFQDVALAIDKLRSHSAQYNLDADRTVVIGHSAGGHLALWASLRDRLPAESPLRTQNALIPGAVISLGGIPDLKAFARFVPLFCGPGIMEKLAPRRGPGAGHFDLVAPGTPAWEQIEARIVAALTGATRIR